MEDLMEKEGMRPGRSSSMDALYPDLSLRLALKNCLNDYANETMMSYEPMRVALLGKTGSGKSSLANTIFGEDFFERNSNVRSASITEANEFFEEMLSCITDLAPGPHVFLLVLRVERFARYESGIIESFIKLFSIDALKYTVVVFTHGDEGERRNQSIEELIRGSDVLKKLISDCGNRYLMFNIERKQRSQVTELTKKIDDTVKKNNGKYYANDVLQVAKVNLKMERNYKEDAEKVEQKNTNNGKDLQSKYEEKYRKKHLEGALSMFKELLKKCIIVG